MKYVVLIFAVMFSFTMVLSASFDHEDRKKDKAAGSRYVKKLPKGSTVIKINGPYLSFEYDGQCFLTYAPGSRSGTLAKIDC